MQSDGVVEPILADFKSKSHDHRHCVAAALAAAEELCADRGLRLTALRRRVLELIWGRHRPARAYDLLDQLRGERRRAAPPTVYRALEFLLAHGLVHRIETLNAYVGCGEPGSRHAGQFLICRDCHAVAELDDPEIAHIVADKADRLGFRVQRQTIEVIGICPDCDGPADGGDSD